MSKKRKKFLADRLRQVADSIETHEQFSESEEFINLELEDFRDDWQQLLEAEEQTREKKRLKKQAKEAKKRKKEIAKIVEMARPFALDFGLIELTDVGYEEIHDSDGGYSRTRSLT